MNDDLDRSLRLHDAEARIEEALDYPHNITVGDPGAMVAWNALDILEDGLSADDVKGRSA